MKCPAGYLAQRYIVLFYFPFPHKIILETCFFLETSCLPQEWATEERRVGNDDYCCRKTEKVVDRRRSNLLEWFAQGVRETPYSNSVQFYDLLVNLEPQQCQLLSISGTISIVRTRYWLAEADQEFMHR